MTPREMACIELVELLTDHLEGALPPGGTAAVDAHLASCPPCRIHLAQLQATIDALGRMPQQTVPDAAYATLLAAFRNRFR